MATRAAPAPLPALLAALALAVAGLTLVFPSSPTYDPWAWIVWGREVAHLDLSTVAGPSWKPLPVLVTTPLSLFGGAAPALWLVVARAGGVATVMLAFAVGRRLGGTVAGLAAAGALLCAPWLLRNAALGNSEGLMAAAVLGGVDRHLAGRPTQAFGCGVLASLLRPEAWPFLGLYALWLLVRSGRAALLTVLGGLGCLPLLWFLPELWGSGDLFRASERAQQPLANSAAFAQDPAVQVLRHAAGLLTAPAWAGVAVAAVLVVSRRPAAAAWRPVAALALLALAWVAEVAAMTAHGYSGNERYLIVPAVLGTLVGAVGLGWAAQSLRPHMTSRAGVALGVLAAALLAAPTAGQLAPLTRELRYQGELPHRLAAAVAAAGGAGRLRACGQPFTGPFLVPAVAWQLHVHTSTVGLEPRPPAVVFRVRTTSGARLVPAVSGLAAVRGGRTLGSARNWRIVGACR